MKAGDNMNSSMEYEEYRQNIIIRLKRIEGQVKGIYNMIEQDKNCVDILIQVAAVRAAVNRVGGLILQNHSKKCVKQVLESEKCPEVINELVDTIQKFLKFVD